MDEATYWQLHDRGVAAVKAARLPEAAPLFAAAEAEAKRLGCRALADRAYCNQAAVVVETRSGGALLDGLTRILGASPDAKARQLAAYNLAVVYRRAKRLRAARLYAETALRLACTFREASRQAPSLDFLGLLTIQEGRTADGAELLERSLDASEGGDPLPKSLIVSTLAYCASVAGRRAEALRRLEEGLELFGCHPAPVYEQPVRLNAGYTLLEVGDPEAALANGLRVLDLHTSERTGDEDKYALYLVGEALAQQGDRREAKEQFVLLQRKYYPQIPGLPEMLLSSRSYAFLNWLA